MASCGRDISLKNIAGRELICGSWEGELHVRYITQAESSPRESRTPLRHE